MDSNLTTNVSGQIQDGLISFQTYLRLTLGLGILNTCVALLGISTNIINMIVFLKSGIDGCPMTFSFVILTVSDLSFLVLISPFLTFHILMGIGFTSPTIPLTLVGVMLMPYWHMANSVSVCMTVFIALFKTCCVAMPLKFKNLITNRRILAILVSIILVLLVFYLPVISTMTIDRRMDPSSNRSVYFLRFSHARPTVMVVFHAAMHNVIPTVAQVVVIGCLIILAKKIKESIEFRRLYGYGTEYDPSIPIPSPKEMQAIKAVTVVSAMFVVCNLPPVVVSYAQYIEPEFADGHRYVLLYIVVSIARLNLLLICSSLNILVYLKFNRRYRQTLLPITARICPHFSP